MIYEREENLKPLEAKTESTSVAQKDHLYAFFSSEVNLSQNTIVPTQCAIVTRAGVNCVLSGVADFMVSSIFRQEGDDSWGHLKTNEEDQYPLRHIEGGRTCLIIEAKTEGTIAQSSSMAQAVGEAFIYAKRTG